MRETKQGALKMPSVQKTTKKCATCQYWEGARHFSTSNFIHFDETGICMASRSFYKGKKDKRNAPLWSVDEMGCN